MDGDVTVVWERLPDETSRSYAAFCQYRNLGPQRSLKKAAALHYEAPAGTDPKPSQVGQLKEWSRTYRWQQRVAAYDAEQDRANRQQRQQAAEDARDRAVRGAQLLQRIALKGLMQVDGRIPNAEENPPASLLRYYREGVELEFLALGLPISVVRQQVEAPDPEELERQERAETYRRASKALD